jgi:hypothetical protein
MVSLASARKIESIGTQYEYRHISCHPLTDAPRPARASTTSTRSNSFHLLSKLSNTSVGSDIRLDLGSRLSSCNNSTREFAKQISIALTKSTRTSQRVSFTSTTKSRTARRALISGKQFPSKRRSFHRCLDILKHISLGQNVTTLANLKGVAGIVVPIVVYGVQQSPGLDFWGAAGGLVYVVIFEGYLVRGAIEV